MKKELTKTIIFFSFFLFTISIFFGCSKVGTNKYDFYVEDGLIYNIKTSKYYTGTIVDTLQRRVLSYEVVEGKKNGTFTIKYLNGNIEMTGEVKNDLNEGRWKYYYENGKLESEGDFKNDKAIGEWNWFYPNGNKKENGFFDEGKKEGTWTFFNEDGGVKNEIVFRDGEMITGSDIESKFIKSI